MKYRIVESERFHVRREMRKVAVLSNLDNEHGGSRTWRASARAASMSGVGEHVCGTLIGGDVNFTWQDGRN